MDTQKFTAEQMKSLRQELETRLCGEMELWLEEHIKGLNPVKFVQINGAALNAIARMMVGTICAPHGLSKEGHLVCLEALVVEMRKAIIEHDAAQNRKRFLDRLYSQFHSTLQSHLRKPQ